MSLRPIPARLAELRKLAQTNPRRAQNELWEWFSDLGSQLPAESADKQLNELFIHSTPGSTVSGETAGILLGWVKSRPPTFGARCVVAGGKLLSNVLHFVPWKGKKFDFQAKNGINILSRGGIIVRPITKLRKDNGRYLAFPMRNWVEPGKANPDTQVMVIDYASVPNAWPVKVIRDELVEILPGTYLGKMLWVHNGIYTPTLYFALKSPVG